MQNRKGTSTEKGTTLCADVGERLHHGVFYEGKRHDPKERNRTVKVLWRRTATSRTGPFNTSTERRGRFVYQQITQRKPGGGEKKTIGSL